ncbi:MAG: TolC family protein [Firmicutes bacterium]|jgi:outer membrane protein TolC|nr:TolC family protein [Bacillota bacterium]
MWKKHKTFLICLSFVLLFSGLVNAAAGEISLNDAIHRALQESLEFKIAQLEWENAKLAYQKASADNLLTQSAYNQRLAELDLLKAEKAYKNSIANVVVSAVEKFRDVTTAQMNLRISEEQLRLKQKAKDLTEKKLQMQNASEYDLLQAEAALASSEMEHQAAVNSLEEKKQAFWLLINSQDVMPDGSLSFAPFEAELAEVLPGLLEASVAIKEAEDSLALSRLNWERLRLEETADLMMREAENAVRLAELRVEQAKANLTQQAQAAFNGVKQAEQAYRARQVSLQLEQRVYDITKGQVEAGLKTDDDLSNAQISLWQAERSVYEALSNYIVAYLQWEDLIGRDVRNSVILQPIPVGAEG